MKIGNNKMKLCIKIFGTINNGVINNKEFVILPYKSKKNKKFENDIWKKLLPDGKITTYMKLDIDYFTAKKIANEKLLEKELIS